ncbi:MAG: hypothetical protein AAGK21_17115, partial [Bacteroidota bacterium]
VLVDVAVEGAITVTGSTIAGPIAFAVDADAERVLVAVGNPTDEAISLADVDIAGGTLADVALTFDPASGAFVPVGLSGHGGAESLALGAFEGVILQVTPDGDPADVAVSVSAETAASVESLVTAGSYVAADGETPLLVAVSEAGASGGASGAGRQDTAVIRFQVGDAALDALDGFDIASPSGLTLGASGWGDGASGSTASGGPFAALAGWDLETGPVTVPLAVDVPAAGDYEFSLVADPGAVGPRDVLVTLVDGTTETTLEAGTPYAFSVGDGEDLAGRFALVVSLGAAVSTEGDPEGDPEGAVLSVYPNPSAGAATVSLTGIAGEAGSSGEAGGVGEARVAVYDALGREVAVLHEGPSAGAVTVSVDAGRLAPGAYVIRAEAGAVVRTQALTIVR